jgi:ABC-type nitrate/sulfonate/bicarbonate transport system substrate-binding protein
VDEELGMHTVKNPKSKQTRKSIAALILLLQLCLGSAHAQDREKIRVALSTVSFTFLVNLIAKDAGIFRKHGLDVESILVSGPAQVAALAAGEIDYNSSFIPGLLLAAKGLPATIVMATTKTPLFI